MKSSSAKASRHNILQEIKHISDVAGPLDSTTNAIFLRYGLNNRPNDTPPVVTQYPELLVLRGIYLVRLAKEMNAKHFAEVGTARGFQSMMWANYLMDSKHEDGSVHTCDINGADERIYKTPETGDELFTRNELWENAPQNKFIHFTHGHSTLLAKAITKKLDMVYIDGQHDLEFTVFDFKNLSTHLRPGTIVVFDDCDARFPGVQAAVNRIARLIGVAYTLIEFSPSPYKIAVMKIPVGFTTYSEPLITRISDGLGKIERRALEITLVRRLKRKLKGIIRSD